MRKKIAAVVLLATMAFSLSACSFSNTCKASGCDEEVYKNGYCEYHYILDVGGDLLESLFE